MWEFGVGVAAWKSGKRGRAERKIRNEDPFGNSRVEGILGTAIEDVALISR